jgi:hypothetical protein
LVVVISNLGVKEGLIQPQVAAALVSAAMLSVLTLPVIAGRLRGYALPRIVDEHA